MRVAALVLAGSLCCTLPCQARQFEPDSTRYPARIWSGPAGTFAAGDVDGDADLDLLVAREDLWQYRVDAILLRRQGSTWQQTVLGTAAGNNVLPKVDVALVDLDGNAALDAVAVVSGEFPGSSARLVVWRNLGGGAMTGAAIVGLPGSASAEYVAADVDLDGDRDLIVATRLAGGTMQPLVLYRHDGAFGFSPRHWIASAT